ncbi:hypothetical protein Tco_1445610, partial [Tanacetum coccineum]
MLKFLIIKEKTLEKSETSKTTSHVTLDSIHGGFNLNKDGDDLDAEEEKVQEVQPMGRDKSKKKTSSSTARLESSTAVALALVEQL